MKEYVLSVFDKLENIPHVVRVQSETDDLSEIILLAYTQLVDNPDPLTREEVDAQEELFADFVIISVFVDPGKNLIPDLEKEDGLPDIQERSTEDGAAAIRAG